MSGLRRSYNRDGERVGAVARLLGAEGYERSRIQPYVARVHDVMLDSLAGRVDSPCRILDVGCGTGRLLRRLCQRWPAAEMTGVDPNEGMVSVAKQWCPSASFWRTENPIQYTERAGHSSPFSLASGRPKENR